MNRCGRFNPHLKPILSPGQHGEERMGGQLTNCRGEALIVVIVILVIVTAAAARIAAVGVVIAGVIAAGMIAA